MQYRWLAKQHLENAGKLLAAGDSDRLTYVCLELRKCIEALSYEILTGYLAEASLKVIETWQPDKVMKELVRIDPWADQSSFLRWRREGSGGEPDGERRNLGEDRRPKAAWVTKSYHQLGSFLHVPTVRQQRNGLVFDAAACRERSTLIHDELKRILEPSIWNANFSESVTYHCTCEAAIKRRIAALASGPIECGNCGQLYDVEPRRNGSYAFIAHSFSWDCKLCGEKQEILQSMAREGLDISCKCGDRATLKLRSRWIVDREADAERTDDVRETPPPDYRTL
ncbi:hypothetical protein Q2941_12295 [Bradyrhizobium sp. UFLA05-153]